MKVVTIGPPIIPVSLMALKGTETMWNGSYEELSDLLMNVQGVAGTMPFLESTMLVTVDKAFDFSVVRTEVTQLVLGWVYRTLGVAFVADDHTLHCCGKEPMATVRTDYLCLDCGASI